MCRRSGRAAAPGAVGNSTIRSGRGNRSPSLDLYCSPACFEMRPAGAPQTPGPVAPPIHQKGRPSLQDSGCVGFRRPGWDTPPEAHATRKTMLLPICSIGRTDKRREQSRTRPLERDVLARIGRPLKLVAEGIDGADRRFPPGHDLSGSGLGAGQVDQLWILSRRARQSGQGLRPRIYVRTA